MMRKEYRSYLPLVI